MIYCRLDRFYFDFVYDISLHVYIFSTQIFLVMVQELIKFYSLSLHIMVSEPADFPKSGLWPAGSFIVTHVETK